MSDCTPESIAAEVRAGGGSVPANFTEQLAAARALYALLLADARLELPEADAASLGERAAAQGFARLALVAGETMMDAGEHHLMAAGMMASAGAQFAGVNLEMMPPDLQRDAVSAAIQVMVKAAGLRVSMSREGADLPVSGRC